MSIISGAWDYFNRTEESLSGMQEEAKSLSNSIAELAPKNLITLIKTNTGSLDKQYSNKIKKLWHFGQIKDLLVLDLTLKPIHSYNENSENTFKWELNDKEKSLLKNRKVLATEIVKSKEGLILSSIAGLVDDYGNISGFIQVDIDATIYGSLVNSILLKNLFLILLSLAIGFLVSTMISRTISKRLKQLTDSAIKVAKGNYSTKVDAGTIQEVEDLSNTFNTMSSVLGDVLEKAQRTLIESEIFRENQVLNTAFRENIEVNTVTETNFGSLFNLYGPAGSINSLTTIFETKENIYGVYLKLKDNSSSELEDSFLLENAFSYIKALISEKDDLDIKPFKEALISFSSALILHQSKSDLQSLDLITMQKQSHDADKPFSLGDYSKEVDTLLGNYFKAFPDSRDQKSLVELKKLWPESMPGCILYFLPKLAQAN